MTNCRLAVYEKRMEFYSFVNLNAYFVGSLKDKR